MQGNILRPVGCAAKFILVNVSKGYEAKLGIVTVVYPPTYLLNIYICNICCYSVPSL